MYRSSCPNTGSNPGGGRILKKKSKRHPHPEKTLSNTFFEIQSDRVSPLYPFSPGHLCPWVLENTFVTKNVENHPELSVLFTLPVNVYQAYEIL